MFGFIVLLAVTRYIIVNDKFISSTRSFNFIPFIVRIMIILAKFNRIEVFIILLSMFFLKKYSMYIMIVYKENYHVEKFGRS